MRPVADTSNCPVKLGPQNSLQSEELDLSSFRESGEIEYNADSAYVLKDDGSVEGVNYIRALTLGHVKNRHGEKVDRKLRFHMPRMEFTALEMIEISDDPFGGCDD